MSTDMKLYIQAVSDVGVRRSNNEDMISVGGIMLRDSSLDFPVEMESSDESYFYLLISDGMGGHEDGEKASGYLLETIRESFASGRVRTETAEEDLMDIVRDVSESLNLQAAEAGQSKPMGCTLTGVIWTGGRTLLVNAGDSRTYRLRDGFLKQLTTDETESGITYDENADKLLLNAIGGGSFGRLVVEDISDRLMDGDMLLVCSDGLTDMVSDDDIESIMSSEAYPAQKLMEAANTNGGIDNISVITVVVENK